MWAHVSRVSPLSLEQLRALLATASPSSPRMSLNYFLRCGSGAAVNLPNTTHSEGGLLGQWATGLPQFLILGGPRQPVCVSSSGRLALPTQDHPIAAASFSLWLQWSLEMQGCLEMSLHELSCAHFPG